MLSHTPRNRAPGSEVVVNYPNEEAWHARLVLEWVGGDMDNADICISLTPDGDMVVEDCGAQGEEVAGVMSRPADRSAPTGISADLVYDFAAFPNAGIWSRSTFRLKRLPTISEQFEGGHRALCL